MQIYNPPKEHKCELSEAWRDTENVRRGAVEVCTICEEAYVYDPIPWEQVYRRIRMWPFDRVQRREVKKWKERKDNSLLHLLSEPSGLK